MSLIVPTCVTWGLPIVLMVHYSEYPTVQKCPNRHTYITYLPITVLSSSL